MSHEHLTITYSRNCGIHTLDFNLFGNHTTMIWMLKQYRLFHCQWTYGDNCEPHWCASQRHNVDRNPYCQFFGCYCIDPLIHCGTPPFHHPWPWLILRNKLQLFYQWWFRCLVRSTTKEIVILPLLARSLIWDILDKAPQMFSRCCCLLSPSSGRTRCNGACPRPDLQSEQIFSPLYSIN